MCSVKEKTGGDKTDCVVGVLQAHLLSTDETAWKLCACLYVTLSLCHAVSHPLNTQHHATPNHQVLDKEEVEEDEEADAAAAAAGEYEGGGGDMEDMEAFIEGDEDEDEDEEDDEEEVRFRFLLGGWRGVLGDGGMGA